ncbi:MAG TPA: trigger factor, partial [Thiomicrospira sp.]|nr:trigger factor [Thiomicrospira sp.]
ATFDIVLHSISTKQLPEIDEEFVKSFGVEDGTEESLRSEIKDNMEKELARAVQNANRTSTLDALQEVVDVELPKALVDQEVQNLMNNMVQKLKEQGMQESDINISADQFQGEAEKRVKLGLILGDVIRANDIQADDADVNAFISEQASSYEDPAEVVNWYKENPQALNEIKGIIVENKVAEKIMAEAKVTEVTKSFEEVVNPAG